MSADNGIYIGKFPLADKPGTFEYRVIHAQNIEHVDSGDERTQDLFRACYFGGKDVKVFQEEDAAWAHAGKWSRDFDPLEYGVSMIDFERPMPSISYEEAQRRLSRMWGKKT